jgi:heme-degrading monooxygenase HmoA
MAARRLRQMGEQVITRMWRGRTATENATAYERFLLDELFPSMRAIPGFLGADVLHRVEDKEAAFMTLARFDSIEAIRAFAGDRYETPGDRATCWPAALTVRRPGCSLRDLGLLGERGRWMISGGPLEPHRSAR